MKISHLAFVMLPLLAACHTNNDTYYSDENTYTYQEEDYVPASDRLEVELASPYWDGKTFPATGTCASLGGLALTPPMVIKNAPYGTNVILLEFNNLSVKGLDTKGGLGTVGYVYKAPKDGSEVVLRSIEGGKVELPRPAFLEKSHRVEGARPAAYYAPCLKRSMDQEISVTVKAVRRTGNVYKQYTDVLDEVTIPLGVLKD